MPGISDKNSDKKAYQLTEPNGLVLRFDVKKIYQLLDARRRDENLIWAEVADQIGDFTPGMLTRFKKRGRNSFPGLMRIACYLGVPAKELTIQFPR